MIEGKLENGFAFSVDERIFDDWRFIAILDDIMNPEFEVQISGLRKMALLLFGREGEQKLSKIIASKNGGYVPCDEMSNCIRETINKSKDLKNSASSPTA